MDRELAELRRAVADLGPKQAGRRVPVRLRSRLVAIVRSRRAAGHSLSALADALGLAAETLSRWLAAPAPEAVAGVDRPLPVLVTSPATPPTALTLITPSGYRVEGLSLAAAAELLARLR